MQRLVWTERHDEIETAIRREKQLTKWNRAWKIRLIEAANPDWFDLAVSELGFPSLRPFGVGARWAPAFAGVTGTVPCPTRTTPLASAKRGGP